MNRYAGEGKRCLLLILIILSLGLVCFGTGNTDADSVHDQLFSLARVTDEQVEQQHKIFIEQFHTSDKVRKCLKVGMYVAGAAALAAIGYQLCAPVPPAVFSAPDFKTLSREQLRSLVGTLTERVQRLEIGPNVGSLSWYKSLAISILLTPSTLIDLTRLVLSNGERFLGRRLLSANLSWFLHEKTQLALLTKKDLSPAGNFECELGALLKDLEKGAIVLDGGMRGLLPVDIAYQRRHMAANCKQLAEEVVQLLAFIQYIDSLTDDANKQFESAECARYLVNCTNSFCEGVEARLNHVDDKSFLPLVQSFNSEFQQIVVRFAQSIK